MEIKTRCSICNGRLNYTNFRPREITITSQSGVRTVPKGFEVDFACSSAHCNFNGTRNLSSQEADQLRRNADRSLF
jgi:hypothetical protein